jgi:hypothetical protein
VMYVMSVTHTTSGAHAADWRANTSAAMGKGGVESVGPDSVAADGAPGPAAHQPRHASATHACSRAQLRVHAGAAVPLAALDVSSRDFDGELSAGTRRG